jgi:hypothetical protein
MTNELPINIRISLALALVSETSGKNEKKNFAKINIPPKHTMLSSNAKAMTDALPFEVSVGYLNEGRQNALP